METFLKKYYQKYHQAPPVTEKETNNLFCSGWRSACILKWKRVCRYSAGVLLNHP